MSRFSMLKKSKQHSLSTLMSFSTPITEIHRLKLYPINISAILADHSESYLLAVALFSNRL